MCLLARVWHCVRRTPHGNRGRQQVRRFDRGRNHHEQVRLPPADSSATKPVRRQRLDTVPQHDAEYSDSLRYFILAPLLAYFKQSLQSDSHVACDDTGVTLLYPKEPPEFDLSDPKEKRISEVYAEAKAANKPSINAKMWAYRGVNVKLNLFDFTVSRHRDGPELFFQDFKGTLLGDCWHGFEAIALYRGATPCAACNSHARCSLTMRRTTHRIARNGSNGISFCSTSRPCQAVVRRRATAIAADRGEADLGRDAELDGIGDRTQHVVLPKSELRKALNYLSNHWTELTLISMTRSCRWTTTNASN